MKIKQKFDKAVKWFESKGYIAYWMLEHDKHILVLRVYPSDFNDKDEWNEIVLSDNEVTECADKYDEMLEEVA